MKKKKIFYFAIALLLITISCGPRRYKCGPYRKCENSIDKNIKKDICYDFNKITTC
jgi:hypothetical protein